MGIISFEEINTIIEFIDLKLTFDDIFKLTFCRTKKSFSK